MTQYVFDVSETVERTYAVQADDAAGATKRLKSFLKDALDEPQLVSLMHEHSKSVKVGKATEQ
jgi:hypothetical protein